MLIGRLSRIYRTHFATASSLQLPIALIAVIGGLARAVAAETQSILGDDGIAKLFGLHVQAISTSSIPQPVLRLKGFRLPRQIIADAVWAYHRFAMSTADVEDLLA